MQSILISVSLCLKIFIPTYGGGNMNKMKNIQSLKINLVKLSFIALFLLSTFPIALYATEESVADKIGAYLKSNIETFSDEELHELVVDQFKTLRLLNSNNEWKSEEFKNAGEELIPANITKDSISDLIDKMVAAAEKNIYLMTFLDQAASNPERYQALLDKIKKEGSNVFPKVIAYSYALENLVKSMRNDWQLLESCMKIWDEEMKGINLNKYLTPIFGPIKYHSVKRPMKQIVNFHKTGNVDPKFLNFMLPLNILEATVTDIVRKHGDNAKAGWNLTTRTPGIDNCGEGLDCGEARFSDDGKAVLISYLLPTKWNDLYQTWNLAFVSHYAEFPYLMPKLLIPQVANYYDSPQEYIYNRGIGLYAFLHFTIFNQIDRINKGESGFNWYNKQLTNDWGKINLESSNEYSEDIRDFLGK
jgi:hypothetical protein